MNLLTQNHKLQLLTIKIENIEWKLKQTISPLKLPITKNNLIYLPTTEVETLVRVWFLLRERDTDLVRERKGTQEKGLLVWEREVYIYIKSQWEKGGLLVWNGAADSRTKKEEKKEE